MCRDVRAHTVLADLPVIAFTAAVPMDAQPSEQLPATAVLPKPVSLHLLVDRVTTMLKGGADRNPEPGSDQQRDGRLDARQLAAHRKASDDRGGR